MAGAGDRYAKLAAALPPATLTARVWGLWYKKPMERLNKDSGEMEPVIDPATGLQMFAKVPFSFVGDRKVAKGGPLKHCRLTYDECVAYADLHDHPLICIWPCADSHIYIADIDHIWADGADVTKEAEAFGLPIELSSRGKGHMFIERGDRVPINVAEGAPMVALKAGNYYPLKAKSMGTMIALTGDMLNDAKCHVNDDVIDWILRMPGRGDKADTGDDWSNYWEEWGSTNSGLITDIGDNRMADLQGYADLFTDQLNNPKGKDRSKNIVAMMGTLFDIGLEAEDAIAIGYHFAGGVMREHIDAQPNPALRTLSRAYGWLYGKRVEAPRQDPEPMAAAKAASIEFNTTADKRVNGVEFKGSDPLNIFDRTLDIPRQFPPGCLPKVIEDMASDFHAQTGFDQIGIAVAAIGTIAGSLTDQYKLVDGWQKEPARPWLLLVGESGAGKSPIIKHVTAPLKAAARARRIDQLRSVIEDEDPPPARPFWTSNATPEGFRNRMVGNPHGSFLFTGELAEWFNFDAYKNAGVSAGRKLWLMAYDGEDYRFMRANREEEAYLSCTVMGGTQPSVIEKAKADLSGDGMLQRLNMVFIEEVDPDFEGEPQDLVSYLAYSHVIDRLTQISDERDIQMEPDAAALFKSQTRHTLKFAKGYHKASGNRTFATHLQKCRGMIMRLALTFHAADCYGEHVAAPVTRDTMRRAIIAFNTMADHTNAGYEMAGLGGEISDGMGEIARYALSTRRDRITSSNITTGVWMFKGGKIKGVMDEALEALEVCGWLMAEHNSQYAKRRSWKVNPAVHDLYASEGDTQRAKHKQLLDHFKTTKDAALDELDGGVDDGETLL